MRSFAHGVWSNTNATTAIPSRMPTSETSATRVQRATRMSERLTDAHVNPPAPRFGLSVDHETRNGVELIAKVGPQGPDGRLVPQASADVHAKAQPLETQVTRLDAPRIDERHARDLAGHRKPKFRRDQHQRS